MKNNIQQLKGTNRQLADLLQSRRSTSVGSRSYREYISDSERVASDEASERRNLSGLRYGVVTYALPYANWYRVSVAGSVGVIGCTSLTQNSSTPLGVRHTGIYQPSTQVLVYVFPEANYGLIVGAIPDRQIPGSLISPDWVSQFGQSGFIREKCYSHPIESMFRSGGVIDFSNNRPIDSTMFDQGLISSTGIGLHIDDFQTFLRVNELCGLFLNYFDGHTRLAGQALQIMSSAHELLSHDDEGELQLLEGVALYPWESLGAFSPTHQLFSTTENAEVRNSDKAKFDVDQEVDPFYRYRRYGGYLGQGTRRQVVLPASLEGANVRNTELTEVGVFDESVSASGGYHLRSASHVFIEKEVIIPVAKRVRDAADGREDSDSSTNYRASGYYGEGDEHNIGNVQGTPTEKIVGLEDVVEHGRLRADDPFAKHTGDFHIPDPSAFSAVNLSASQDTLNFQDADLSPTPVSLPVDHRHTAEFTKRKAGVYITDDGSLVLRCGYGSQITLTNGQVLIDAPKGVHVRSGSEVLLLGSDVILTAHDSVDVTATNKDVRIKAHNNMQLVSGVSGAGGTLIENQATGALQGYEGNVGEDVNAVGVVVKANQSVVATYASQMYFRTGGGLGSAGPIIFDADSGDSQFIVKASGFQTNTAFGVTHIIGPRGDSSDVNAVYRFAESSAAIPAATTFNGSITSLGGIVADGSVSVTGSYGSTSGGTLIGQIQRQAIIATLSPIQQAFRESITSGRADDKSQFNDNLYQSGGLGNDRVITAIGFSYRDVQDESQYGTADFEFLSPRWQQMLDTGQAIGGKPWQDQPVEYQNQELYPWPGRKAILGETLLRAEGLSLYDTESGRAKDGKSAGSLTLETVKRVPMLGNMKIIK